MDNNGLVRSLPIPLLLLQIGVFCLWLTSCRYKLMHDLKSDLNRKSETLNKSIFTWEAINGKG